MWRAMVSHRLRFSAGSSSGLLAVALAKDMSKLKASTTASCDMTSMNECYFGALAVACPTNMSQLKVSITASCNKTRLIHIHLHVRLVQNRSLSISQTRLCVRWLFRVLCVRKGQHSSTFLQIVDLTSTPHSFSPVPIALVSYRRLAS